MPYNIKYPFARLVDVTKCYREQIDRAIKRVLDSGYYIGGPEVADFENLLASTLHAPHAIGVSNGLDALRLIFRAYIELGRLHEGDEVIVPANTYVASVLAITDNNLTPIFVEPDINTLNLNSSLVEKAITNRTHAIMPVHLYGRVCWDSTLVSIIKKHNLIVVEDNAQAIGAEASLGGLFSSRHTAALGHAGAISFYPTKNVGALGDGGAVITHDQDLADAIRALRNYGSDRQYHNIYKGFNCRLDPIQAAILSIKLKHIQHDNQQRRLKASIYNSLIQNSKIIKPLWSEGNDNVWHQYIVRVNNRDDFRKFLLENGVETAVHYATPPHRQPCYSEYANLHLPVTDSIANSVVSLPITATTSTDDAHCICNIINKY